MTTSSEQERIDKLAKELEVPRALRLLAEWVAIENNETRLQAEKYVDEAQQLADYLYVIGYRLFPSIPSSEQVREQLTKTIDAAGLYDSGISPRELTDQILAIIQPLIEQARKEEKQRLIKEGWRSDEEITNEKSEFGLSVGEGAYLSGLADAKKELIEEIGKRSHLFCSDDPDDFPLDVGDRIIYAHVWQALQH